MGKCVKFKVNTVKMKLILTICLLLINQSILGQKKEIDKKVERIVEEIAEARLYVSKEKAWVGGITEQWARFEKLKNRASDDELIILTNHESAVVKCYSFMALVERKHELTFQILIAHILDQQKIHRSIGCVFDEMTIGQFYLNTATPNVRELSGYELNENQKNTMVNLDLFKTDKSFEENSILLANTIDSLMLFDQNLGYPYSSKLMKRIEPKASYYERIKEVYTQKRERDCLTAIAKYKKQEDISLLIGGLEDGNVHTTLAAINAVKYFPDKALFPYLQDLHKKEMISLKKMHAFYAEALYKTIVQYKNQESRFLIENTLNNKDKGIVKFHVIYIKAALMEYPDPIYIGIEKRLNAHKLKNKK